MSVNHVTDETFVTEVLSSETPVLVDFWAGWCPPCRAMAPVLDKYAEEQAGRIKVVKIDADENPIMAGEYEIRSLPTMLLFQNGQPIGRFVGYMPGTELAAHVNNKLGAAK